MWSIIRSANRTPSAPTPRVGMAAGVFEATNLMIKHSNEYRAPKPGEEAHEKYKTLIKQSGP